MVRGLSDQEKALLRRLVGDGAPFLPTLEIQMEACLVQENAEGGLDFKPIADAQIDTDEKVLGSGSLYDADGVPIIFDLLQDGGFISMLLIQKADSSRIKSPMDYQNVKSLGFGQGLTLER